MLATLAEAVSHTWTLNTGETVTGDYVSSGTTTLVVKTGGTNCFLKISSLASDDQAYVAELKATRTTATIIRQPGKGNIVELSLPEPPAAAPGRPAVVTIPLIEAVKTNDMEQVKALLESSPEQIKASDEKGLTALHWAATDGSVEAVQALLAHGAEVNAKTKGDRTPLHQAVRYGNLTVVKLLLDNNADVNAIDRGGVTPLILAATFQKDANIVKLLLDHKADVNIIDTFGGNALLMAAEQGSGEEVKMLLNAGSDINVCDKLGGDTALIAAVLHRCPTDVIELLLEKKPDLTVKNRDGFTALEAAKVMGRNDVVQLLNK